MLTFQAELERVKHELAASRESEMQLMKLSADLKRTACNDLAAKSMQSLLLRHANRKLKTKLLETLQQLDQSISLDARKSVGSCNILTRFLGISAID